MRAKHTALILTAGFLLIPTLTWSQGPGGRLEVRGYGGGQPGSPAPGGGMYQPPGGGERPSMRVGGMGGMSGMDPDRIFDMLAKGKEVIKLDEMDPFAKGMFDRFSRSFGLTGNEITRDQFKSAMTKVREMAASGQLPGMGGSGLGGADGDRRLEETFKRMDRNEDGVLDNNEMSDTLRDGRDRYDPNHDGMINLEEFKSYVSARRGDGEGDRERRDGDGTRRPRGEDDPDVSPDAERKRPNVVRAGNMPREFPFADLDRDTDGQVGLYEWKEAGRGIAQFLTMDLNNDGFLTVDEYLRFKRQGDEQLAKSGSQGGQFGRGGGGMPGMNPGMMAMAPGMMPGANRWGGAGGGGFGGMTPTGPMPGGFAAMGGMPGGMPWAGGGGMGAGRGPSGPGGVPGMTSFRMDGNQPGGFGGGGFRGERAPGGTGFTPPMGITIPGGFRGGMPGADLGSGMGFRGQGATMPGAMGFNGGGGGFRGDGGTGGGFRGQGGPMAGPGFPGGGFRGDGGNGGFNTEERRDRGPGRGREADNGGGERRLPGGDRGPGRGRGDNGGSDNGGGPGGRPRGPRG